MTRLIVLKLETRALIRDDVFMVDNFMMGHYEMKGSENRFGTFISCSSEIYLRPCLPVIYQSFCVCKLSKIQRHSKIRDCSLCTMGCKLSIVMAKYHLP